MKNGGFAPIVIILVVVALLGMGAGGFVLISKNAPPTSISPTPFQNESTPTPSSQTETVQTKTVQEPSPSSQTETTPSSKSPLPSPLSAPSQKLLAEIDVQGFWKIDQIFLFDQVSGEEMELPLTEEQLRLYYEFKESVLCMGKFGEGGTLLPCSVSIPFNLRGNTIVLEQGSGQSGLQVKMLQRNTMELVSDDNMRTVFYRPDIPVPPEELPPSFSTQRLRLDPAALVGIWKIERAWNRDQRGFVESKESARHSGYQEFKSGSRCDNWPPDLTKCYGYAPYVVTGNKIKAGRYGVPGVYAWYIWDIIDGKLALTGEHWKGIYKKVAAYEGAVIQNDPVTSPTIDSILVNTASVKVGGEVTITCKASDNTEVSWIDFSIVGPKVQHGWRYNPETKFNKALTASYTYTVPDSGTYKISCHTFDNEENEAFSDVVSVTAL